MGLYRDQTDQNMRSLQDPSPRNEKNKRISNEDSSEESFKFSKLKDNIAPRKKLHSHSIRRTRNPSRKLATRGN